MNPEDVRLIAVNPLTQEPLAVLTPEATCRTMDVSVTDMGNLPFTLPETSPLNALLVEGETEVHVAVGPTVHWVFVVDGKRPNNQTGQVEYTCPSAEWWFSKRYLGKFPATGYLRNGTMENGTTRPWTPVGVGGVKPIYGLAKAPTYAGARSMRVQSTTRPVRWARTRQTDGLFAGTAITTAGKKAFRRTARAIPRGVGTVTVTGHTDNTASKARSQAVGLARAQAAAAVIRKTRPGLTVVARSAGETQPVVSNRRPADRARNRRVEVRATVTPPVTRPNQAVAQTVVFAPSNRPRTATAIARVRVPAATYKGPAADDAGMVILLPDGKRKLCPINAATPKDAWVRMEASFKVPANTTYRVQVNLHAPQGVAFWDEVSLVADDALHFDDVDQGAIFRALVAHVQDPAMGQVDLGIKAESRSHGVKRDMTYFWHERQNALDVLRDWGNLLGGFEVSIEPRAGFGRSMVAHYPRKGREHTALVLDEQTNATITGLDQSAASLAHMAVVRAEGEGPTRDEGFAVLADRKTGLQTIFDATPGSALSSLQGQADRVLGRYSQPIVTPQAVLSLEDLEPTTIAAGDILEARYRSPHTVWTGRVRVMGMTFDWDNGTVSLNNVPWDKWSV